MKRKEKYHYLRNLERKAFEGLKYHKKITVSFDFGEKGLPHILFCQMRKESKSEEELLNKLAEYERNLKNE